MIINSHIPNWTKSTPAANTEPTKQPVATDPTGGLANKDVFLKLMVAQLQHQDPSSPADPTQFVTQLAQMNGVEQMIQINTRLGSILAAVQNLAPPATTTPKQ